jgi:hypothetical protein
MNSLRETFFILEIPSHGIAVELVAKAIGSRSDYSATIGIS